MLRCPPSRINLTSADISGLDRRLAARQSARHSRQGATKVRLSTGPSRSTGLSIVLAKDNKGKERAESSSSEATVYNNEERSSLKDGSDLTSEAALALENVVIKRGSPERPSPRGRVDSFYNPEQSIDIELDGTHDESIEYTSINASPSTPFTRRGNRVLGEIQPDAYPFAGGRPTEPQAELRLLSSARARRRNARSHDFQLHEDSAELQEHISAHHLQRPVWRGAPSVPELHLPESSTQPSLNMELDPGAPVFVPRTRFGSAVRSSAESGPANIIGSHWAGLDTTHNAWNLRIRSTSEQNAEAHSHWRHDSGQETTDTATSLGARQDLHLLYRSLQHRSQGEDQNSSIFPSAPNLERYPLLRPPSNLGSQRRTSSQLRLAYGEARDVSTSLLVPPSAVEQPSTVHHQQPELHVRHAFADGNSDPRGIEARIRSVSPGISTISRSTPNLLSLPFSAPCIGSRGSSWSWANPRPHWRSSSRIPSMVSAASGVSGDDAIPHPLHEELDAAQEFIRRRNSPLDELTEKFSRMRSVGRSWERTPGSRTRPSLLNGDPFGHDSTLYAAQRLNNEPVFERALLNTKLREIADQDDSDSSDEDPVALSLALPPSSPLPSCPEEVISSPAMPSQFPISPPSPSLQCSPAKSSASPRSAIKRKPVPNSTTTAKLNVYNDNQPAKHQQASSTDFEQAKPFSNAVTQQSPITIGHATFESAYNGPERHAYRNTYPPILAPQIGAEPVVQGASAAGVMLPTTRLERVHQHRSRRRARSQRSGQQAENDVEGQLPGLQEDRRVWLNRREAGTLDVTPPKEGRFERFLS